MFPGHGISYLNRQTSDRESCVENDRVLLAEIVLAAAKLIRAQIYEVVRVHILHQVI